MISNNPAVHDNKDPGTQLNTKLAPKRGVSIHWTGLLDWNTGLDYWTELFFILCTSEQVYFFTWIVSG